jgi:hypothetical protein
MRWTFLVGLALVVLGVLALVYQGFTYVTHDQVAVFGPLQVWQERAHTVWLPPVLGITALVVGGLLLLVGSRQGQGSV